MSVNIFHSNKPQSFNDCYFAEPTIKQELSSYANNPLNGCLLLYGAYGTGKSTAVELIVRDTGAAKSDIHYVHTNRQSVWRTSQKQRANQCNGV
jgi:replication-associated recombination protein RarA